jgi:hypothetical protein
MIFWKTLKISLDFKEGFLKPMQDSLKPIEGYVYIKITEEYS